MARKKQVVLSGKGPALSVVRKPNKLLWMHGQDGRPGFWLDDLAALQAFTNHVLEQGIEQGRRAERADVCAMLERLNKVADFDSNCDHGCPYNEIGSSAEDCKCASGEVRAFLSRHRSSHLGAAGKGGRVMAKILTREELRDLVLRAVNEGPGVIGPSVAIMDHDAALRELVKQAIDMLECQDNVVITDGAGNPRYEMCFVCEQQNYLLNEDLIHSVDCPRANWLARAREVADV